MSDNEYCQLCSHANIWHSFGQGDCMGTLIERNDENPRIVKTAPCNCPSFQRNASSAEIFYKEYLEKYGIKIGDVEDVDGYFEPL